MYRRRSRLEIILNILSTIRDGTDKPTNIMYAVNLSWKPTQKMLSNLMEQDLIELRIAPGKSRRRYGVTERGVKLLDYFEKANEVLPKEEYADLYSTRAVPS